MVRAYPSPACMAHCIGGRSVDVHRKRQGISKLVSVCEDVFADPWAGDMLHGNAQ